MKPTTREFIERSTSGERDELTKRHAYYSVYRDPRESMNKWREHLSDTQKDEIASIFCESPYRDLWPDLSRDMTRRR
jgi:hypothetical protein